MNVRISAARAGFTLVEMLLASTLGALLLAAAASSAGSFADTVAHLQAEHADSYENVLARIDRDVRYAWCVSVPSRDQLLITGPDNLVTEYYRVGNSLLVTRPDGSSGSVITGLATCGFVADSVQRLRSGHTATVSGAMYVLAAPGGTTASPLSLTSGQSLALSFVGGSDAGARMVAGTHDRYTAWTPTSSDLPLAGSGAGTVTFSLYPSFGPGRADPRTGAAALASWSMALSALPAGTVVSRSPRVVYAAPGATVPVAIPALSLQPGVAYRLVMDVSGAGCLIVAQYGSTSRNDEMVKTGATWQALAGTVPFTLHADATCTTTNSTNVAAQVRTTLQADTGKSYVGSACVYTQVLAEDPWLGVVPGEVPAGS